MVVKRAFSFWTSKILYSFCVPQSAVDLHILLKGSFTFSDVGLTSTIATKLISAKNVFFV